MAPAKETPKMEQYKDRIDTLIVVSTLIITASFAAGFTIPGDVDQGTAVNLKRHMFHLFIFSLTFSLYGSIGTTIILIWARLGDLHLTYYAMNYAMPLLGMVLAFMILLLYFLLWLPSTSTSSFVRYISYYPFLILASLIEEDTPQQKPSRV
ncbi:protein ACCELERATED CELL DEATH 6-like [Senna tora]|uniref:Protein ACCELERATED CELL DEATH 6-like n=1 Tax=Senna tora TaxID=362788 RepID=A0A834TJM5_9FABA|nr:protein ACCELERATED CELL DEATH 6-like [Senna tora]